MKLSQDKMLRLGMVLVGVVVVYALFSSYSSGKSVLVDKAEELGGLGVTGPLSEQGPYMPAEEGHSLGGNAVSVANMQGRVPSSQQTYTQTVLNSGDLLPKGEMGASWAAVNPASMDDLAGQNFLQSGYHSTTNVLGILQTNRNPSYDIRTETPNPQAVIGPFLQTTIDPDPFKSTRPLEGLAS